MTRRVRAEVHVHPISTDHPGSLVTSPSIRAQPPAGDSLADRRVMTVITLVMLSITVLQRFAIPVGPLLSVSVLVTLAGLGYLLAHGDAVENPAATRTFVLATAVCCLTAGVVLVHDRGGSLTSLVYLLLIWIAFCFRLHPARHGLYPRVLDRFEKLMVAFAVVGLLQTLAQAARVWTYQDFILDLVPEQLLFTGYNTSYPVQYGSPIIKANGFVFLEPSVYAQFLAMALLCTLVRRAHPLRTVLLAGALVCTISGTGLMFAGFGVLVLAVRRGGAWTARIVVGAVVIAAVALSTPFGQIFLSRSTEASNTNSSGSLRFVQPYQRILDAWGDEPLAVLIGKGPGTADALASEIFERTGLPINFSGVAKLIFEYGLPAAVLFSVFVALAVARRAPAPTLALSGVFANAFLTGSLLQPQVLYLMVPLCSLFIGLPYERQVEADHHRRGSRRPQARPGTPPPLTPGGVPITVPRAHPSGLDRN